MVIPTPSKENFLLILALLFVFVVLDFPFLTLDFLLIVALLFAFVVLDFPFLTLDFLLIVALLFAFVVLDFLLDFFFCAVIFRLLAASSDSFLLIFERFCLADSSCFV